MLTNWFVYIVKCDDSSYYVGITTDLKKRVEDHNDAVYKRAYTKGRLPVTLVYSEMFKNKFSAAKREREIKGWSRSKKEMLVESLRRAKRDGE